MRSMDARAWDERYAAAERVWSAGPNRFVAEALADLPPGDAVDLACGEGRNALWLARRGWHVTALDFSAVAVDRGREAAAADPGLADGADGADGAVDWRVGDVLDADLPEVDLALLAYLQLPADERRVAVRRAWRAVRPGGTLFLVAHDSTNLTEGTGGPKDPAVLYTADDVLADLADEAGGQPEVVRAERVAREVAPGDDHRGEPARTAWDALVHLRRA